MAEDREYNSNTMSPERSDFNIDPNNDYSDELSSGPEGKAGPESSGGYNTPFTFDNEDPDEILRAFERDLIPDDDLSDLHFPGEEPLTNRSIRDAMTEAIINANQHNRNTLSNSQPTETGSKKEHLKSDAKRMYLEFLDVEEWGLVEQEDLLKDQAAKPLYYKGDAETGLSGMSSIERVRTNARRKLNNATWYKRVGMKEGPTLENLSKNPHLETFTKDETEILMRIPGVWTALKNYAIWKRTDYKLDGARHSFRETKDDRQLMVYRQHMRELVRSSVVNGYRRTGEYSYQIVGINTVEEQIELWCREAEQVAFNLHYVGNYFEGDYRWELSEGGLISRVKDGASINSRAVNAPLKGQLAPLDALIDSTLKNEAGLSTVGSFGAWAYVQTRESISSFEQRTGIRVDHYDEVVLVPKTKSNQNKFWTVENVGTRSNPVIRLNAFEAYPYQFLGSMWEETKLGNRTLMDYLLDPTQVVPPNFNLPGGQTMWSEYDYKIGKAAVMWDYFQGKKPPSAGKGGLGRNTEWITEVKTTLAKRQERINEELLRLILYSSHRVHINKRAPHLAASKASVLTGMSGGEIELLPREDLLYPWDREGFFSKIF